MKGFALTSTLVAGLAAALTSGEASASSLPAAVYSATPMFSGCIDAPGGGCVTTEASAAGTTATVSMGNTPGVIPPAVAAAGVQYSYEVVGPLTVGIPVQALIDFSGSISASATGDLIATADLTVQNDQGGNVLQVCSAGLVGACGTRGSAAGLNTIMPVFVNTPYQVVVGGNAGNFYANDPGVTLPTGSASAVADPTIVIDPTWLANNPGYSIEFSSGITSVPLPAALYLFGVGLAGLA